MKFKPFVKRKLPLLLVVALVLFVFIIIPTFIISDSIIVIGTVSVPVISVIMGLIIILTV